MTSRYDGTCKACGETWSVGDEIKANGVNARGKTIWVHVDCSKFTPEARQIAAEIEAWDADIEWEIIAADRYAQDVTRRAEIMAAFNADPDGFRAVAERELVRAAHAVPQTRDYSDLPAERAYDDAKFVMSVIDPITTAGWDDAIVIGNTQHAYTDETTYVVDLAGASFAAFDAAIRRRLAPLGQMRYLGTSAGTSKITGVTDNEDGTAAVVLSYYIGD